MLKPAVVPGPLPVTEIGWGEGVIVGMEVAPAGLEVTVEVTVTLPVKLKRLVTVIRAVADDPAVTGFGLAASAVILKSGTKTVIRGNWLKPTLATDPVAFTLTTYNPVLVDVVVVTVSVSLPVPLVSVTLGVPRDKVGGVNARGD